MDACQDDIAGYIEQLAERSRDIFWIKSPDFTKQIYINPAYEVLWGRSCESLYKDPGSWREPIHPEDLLRLTQSVAAFRKNPTPETQYNETYRIQRHDGQRLWVRERGFPIYNAQDQLIAFAGTAEDITDLKEKEHFAAQAETLLVERDTFEEHLRSIIESIAGNHWWKDTKGVYRGYNNTLLKTLGYHSQEDIIGKTDYELPWADQADCLIEHDKEVMRRGVPIEREERLTSNKGKDCVYLVNKAPLRDKQNNIVGTIGHGIDITDLKCAQAELEQAQAELEKEKGSIESRLDALIETVVGNHWWKDIKGRYQGCNHELLELYGLESVSQILGKTDYELPWSSEADDVLAYDRLVIDSGKKITIEQNSVVAGGEERTFIVSKAPLRDERGVVIGIIGNSTDITDQKRIQMDLKIAREFAEAANRAKSSFLSVISHELRTPLNGIVGSTQMLRRKDVQPEVSDHVQDIEMAASSLLNLVNEIMDSVTLEQGKFRFVREAFHLQQLVESAVNNIDHRLLGQPLTIQLQCDDNLPDYVMGDAFRIKQILVNLIDNAIKFTKAGSVTVFVRCETYGLHEAEIIFKVEDTGIGIPEDIKERIFEYARGVGLGLSICKQIVEAMGGEIHVESVVDQGTCCWFQIPFKLPIEKVMSENFPDLVSHEMKMMCFPNCRVLLVEDNALNQKVVRMLLESIDCSVDVVSDGKEALRFVDQCDYDIIFMDIGLREMDGITIAKKLRTKHSKRVLPIVGLTAHVMESDIRRCYEVDMNDVLTKPVILEDISQVLMLWCRHRAQEHVEPVN